MNKVEYEDVGLMFKVNYYNKSRQRKEQALFGNGKVAELFVEILKQREDISKESVSLNAWTWLVKVEK